MSFGTTVTVADEETGREATYTLVGPTEADLSAGKLSAESPVAKALMGSRAATRSRSRRRAACAASASCAWAAEPARGSRSAEQVLVDRADQRRGTGSVLVG